MNRKATSHRSRLCTPKVHLTYNGLYAHKARIFQNHKAAWALQSADCHVSFERGLLIQRRFYYIGLSSVQGHTNKAFCIKIKLSCTNIRPGRASANGMRQQLVYSVIYNAGQSSTGKTRRCYIDLALDHANIRNQTLYRNIYVKCFNVRPCQLRCLVNGQSYRPIRKIIDVTSCETDRPKSKQTGLNLDTITFNEVIVAYAKSPLSFSYRHSPLSFGTQPNLYRFSQISSSISEGFQKSCSNNRLQVEPTN